MYRTMCLQPCLKQTQGSGLCGRHLNILRRQVPDEQILVVARLQVGCGYAPAVLKAVAVLEAVAGGGLVCLPTAGAEHMPRVSLARSHLRGCWNLSCQGCRQSSRAVPAVAGSKGN